MVTTAADLGVLMAAIATPYDAEGAVDTGLLSTLIGDYVARGVEGIYCCGSSGEGLLLSADERTAVVETAVSAAEGRIPVVAHVGALSTREAIELARRAQQAGASALSMIPPIYYSFGIEAVLDHYRAVLDAVDLPLIVYNIPQFTGTEFTVETAGELLDDDRVIGLKQTAHNMYALERMKTAFPDKAYINGFDEVFVPALAAGARGTIGTTVGLQVELFQAARRLLDAGDLAGAQRVQSRINHVITELVAIDVFPAAKYLSGRNAGGAGALGDCRRPFRPLSDAGRARLDALGVTLDRFLAEV
ncbi:dihydrodipicolinate synthase family protein [Microbacterium paraoxydans]|uniref:dihydrodipicolinate synthase family protein n=1 Tax=Microbacterium paraoxydans TaxID=199592 RepID=UPI0022860D70|nr:dihydrodipicolinate synthase family protein [Microbacterium paraoxydans]MCZ0709887.1 dihydrodipicolinate synthase family protein [Microbacterium paraoxydans]